MKKLSFVLLMVVFALVVKAGGEATSYITAEGKTYFCISVKPGLYNMILTMSDESTVKIPLKKVEAYSSKGQVFERLPVICEGTSPKCTALMEYVTSRNGFRLYKYCEFNEHGEVWNNSYEKAHPEYAFYVYKDGKFYLPVNKDNASSVLPFFGIQVL